MGDVKTNSRQFVLKKFTFIFDGFVSLGSHQSKGELFPGVSDMELSTSKLEGREREWVKALGAVISGIISVDKR